MKANWNVPFVRWCYGLDVVGYATDNEYGSNLVKRIQKNKWNRYDHIQIIGI
jgi:flagellum-specific peptidoglycan hydrolase FlgJ